MLSRFADEQSNGHSIIAETLPDANSPAVNAGGVSAGADADEVIVENSLIIGETVRDFRSCTVENRVECREGVWQAFLTSQTEKEPLDVLRAVNKFHNQTPYIADEINWQVSDYWETLGEYFLKDGDCEDYAISKYISLKLLGWAPETMRIAVIRDENLRIPHAVLVVYFEGKKYILDNQAEAILTDDRILHYRPVFSINETGWWHHVPQRFMRRFR